MSALSARQSISIKRVMVDRSMTSLSRLNDRISDLRRD
jgi:hypothetical protein